MKNIRFYIFKVSTQRRIFADSLKIAKVTPIFKSGDKGNASNYHSISMLSEFSKVLEETMYNMVYNHLDSKGLYMKNNFLFLHDILQAFLEKGNIHLEFL